MSISVVADYSATEEEIQEFVKGNERCQRVHSRWYPGSAKLYKLLRRGKLPVADHEDEVSSESEGMLLKFNVLLSGIFD